ncbi:MAG: c-type cytochrome biogenesis protein CcmI, partial [Gammaproteobacteria bacterium]
MIAFWIIAGVMVVIALALLLPPLWRRRQAASPDRDWVNLAIARERLGELKAEQRAGQLADADFQRARAELEASLLEDLVQHPLTPTQSRGRRMALALVIFIPALSASVYLAIGHPQALRVDEEELSEGERLKSMVTAIEMVLEKDPQNANAWAMLGEIHRAHGRYAEAVEAYEQAMTLSGSNPDLLVSLADALARSHGNQLSGRPEQLLEEAITLDPKHKKGLSLAGFAAFQEGDHARARGYWQRALETTQQGSPEHSLMQSLIARAEAGWNDENTAANAAPSASLQVRVQLDPKLNGRVYSGDSVFVFAKALNGPPMPLAVTRAQAQSLPLTVSLDDSMAMVPELRLSRFEQVTVGARVSRTGAA